MKNLFLFFILFLFSSIVFSQQKLPLEIKGNWLNSADSIEWMYSFQPKFAVFDTKFWEYKSITQKGKEYILYIANEKEKIQLSVKAIDSNSLLISIDGKTPVYCTNQKALKPDFRNYDTQEFKEPLLVDDTATIYGFIEDYDTTVFSKEGKITYNSILTGFDKDSETEFVIQPDGRFITRFRMFNPQNVWLNIEGSTQTTVFAKPGETQIICLNKLLKELTIDSRKWKDVNDFRLNHYMGKSGKLSEELILLDRYYNYGIIPPQQRITNREVMPQLKYQAWCIQTYAKKIHGLDSIENEMHCSAKARQIMSKTAEFAVLRDLLEYPLFNQTGRQLSQKYIDRLPVINTSSELDLLTANYRFFINYLGFYYKMQVLGGYYLDYCKANMDYYTKYVTDTVDLKLISEWNDFYSLYNWPEFLDRHELKDRENDSLLTRRNYNYYNTMINIAMKYGNKAPQRNYNEQLLKEYDFVLNKYNSGLTGQIYAAYHMLLTQKSGGLDSVYSNWAKLRITNPVLLNYLLETKKTKEEISKKYSSFSAGTQFIDSIASAKNSDAFFMAILNKFKGKVIYIDFWADWCSPCRAEFEPAAKLKQDYIGKDIVFLYFGISCKKNLWDDMIKEKQIEGYHYWLNKDQGSVIYKKFKFNGIPHFLLVDKTGKILESEAPMPSSKTEIREKLDELLK